MSRSHRIFSPFLCLGTFVLVAAACFAQSVPSNGPQNSSGIPAGWPPGATVNVYMNTNVWGQPGSPMYQAVVNGIDAMNQGMSFNQNTFNFIPVDGYPANPQGYWQVVESVADPGGDPNATGFNQYWTAPASGDSLTVTITSSILQLNSGLTNPAAVQYWSDHEEGHNFYLGDCQYCDPNDTIMATDVVLFNDAGPIDGPTSEDDSAAGTYSDYGTSDPGGGGGDGGPGILEGTTLMPSRRLYLAC